MDVCKFLQKKGYNTISPDFYQLIDMWESWYDGNVRSFHWYKVYNGNNEIRCRKLSLQMAKKVSEDMADLLLNERVKIKVDGEANNAFVENVLKRNKFYVKGNDYQERKCYTGTVAYVVQVVNAEVTEDGEIVSGDIAINYVQAKNIYPLSWENGTVSECAFVFPKTIAGKQYAVIQIHTIENGEYLIENTVVKITNGNYREVPEEKWSELKGLETLVRETRTGSDKPQFVIDRLNIVNNADEDDTNPMGIAIFANSIDVLKKIDNEYDSYNSEFALGRKRIFVAPEMLRNVDGNPTFDNNDVIYYQLPEGTLDGGSPIVESNMTLRIQDHSQAINDDLNMLSFKCGFGTERYKFDNGNITTATQVISENSDMYRTIKKHEIILDDVIKDLIRIIIRLGIVTKNTGLKEDAEITIDFDDSIIEDKTAERSQDRQDVSMGVMSHAEYRAKWYNETDEEAEKNLPEQNTVME